MITLIIRVVSLGLLLGVPITYLAFGMEIHSPYRQALFVLSLLWLPFVALSLGFFWAESRSDFAVLALGGAFTAPFVIVGAASILREESR